MEIGREISGNKKAIGILVFGALAFGVNTFDIISLFYLLAQEFLQDVSFLGLMSAALVIGIGLFQIPAGLVAARRGPKVVAVIGLSIIAVSASLIGVATDPAQIIALRFVLGGGLALFFPSAIVMGSQFMKKGSEGLGAGLIVGANAAGGVLALVAWAFVGESFGWRTGILVGALLAALASIVLFLGLPKIPRPELFHMKKSDIVSLLTDRRLIIIGIMLLGSQVGFEQILAFMPFYLQQTLGTAPPVAGLIGSLALLTGLAGSPIIGWLHDRNAKLPRLIIILGTALLLGIAVNYSGSFSLAILSTVVVGFVGGGLFTLLSNAGRERAIRVAKKEEYATLSVNWVHAIALTGTFWAPVLLSTSATQFGYPVAWSLIGVLSFSIIAISVLVSKLLGGTNEVDDVLQSGRL